MSSHADWLYYVLTHLQPALKSIDVRTVAVCFSPEMGWENLVTSIIVSDKEVETVKAEHEQLPQVRNNYFVTLYEAQPFNFQILEEIANGEIKFLTIYGYNKVKSRHADLGNLKVNSSKDWKKKPPQIILKAKDRGDTKNRKKLWDTVDAQKNLPNQFGFSTFEDMIKYCLALEDYHSGMEEDLEVTIIPHSRIEKIKILGKKVWIEIDKSPKLKDLQLNFDLTKHTEDIWIKPAKIDGITNPIEREISKMLPLDVLNVKLIHNKTGLRLDEKEITVPIENVSEPFSKTFNAFCSLKKLEKMLVDPMNYGKSPDKIFENAVTWLLSLAGYETIHTGTVICKLNGKEEKFEDIKAKSGYHIGSADIIAYEENKRLLIIDCDINTVDTKKVQKMAELKNHFREELKGYEKLPITPILFTPIDYRGTSPSPDVMIAGLAVIKRLFEAVVKGDGKEARDCLRYSGF